MNQRDDHDLQERIRKRAYGLWEQEGHPHGRADAHWDMAAELIAIEDNHRLATRPVQSASATGPTGEPIEPLGPAGSMGDMPTLTDQGEEQTLPQEEQSPATAPIDTDAEAARSDPQPARAPAKASAQAAALRSKRPGAGQPRPR